MDTGKGGDDIDSRPPDGVDTGRHHDVDAGRPDGVDDGRPHPVDSSRSGNEIDGRLNDHEAGGLTTDPGIGRVTPDNDAPGHDPGAVQSLPRAGATGNPKARLAAVIALYTLERLGLTALLAFALSYFMPVLVALAFAVVLQMPLAFVLFRGTRDRLSAALAVANDRRRSERDRLRAALAGDSDADPEPPTR